MVSFFGLEVTSCGFLCLGNLVDDLRITVLKCFYNTISVNCVSRIVLYDFTEHQLGADPRGSMGAVELKEIEVRVYHIFQNFPLAHAFLICFMSCRPLSFLYPTIPASLGYSKERLYFEI